MERAVIVATGGAEASQLSSKDTGSAKAFLVSVSDENFWRRNRLLGQLVGPLAAFSSWIRGCDCHEPERLAGKTVECDWAGCRALGLAGRLALTLRALDSLRRDGLATPDLASAASAALGSLNGKMAWVNQPPYTIWQAMCKHSTESHAPLTCLGLSVSCRRLAAQPTTDRRLQYTAHSWCRTCVSHAAHVHTSGGGPSGCCPLHPRARRIGGQRQNAASRPLCLCGWRGGLVAVGHGRARGGAGRESPLGQ